MILVLDTSPICFLVLIGEIELLPRLASEVLITRGVRQELEHPRAPEPVREWARSPPDWLIIREADPLCTAELDFLDLGEREVIAVGSTVESSILVLDDLLAREEAGKRELEVTGLLGLLLRAAKLGLIDLRDALDRLQRTHFRMSRQLVQDLLEESEGRQ